MPQPVLYSLGRVQAEDDEVAVNAAPVRPCCGERSATPLPAEGGATFVHTGSLPGSDLAVPRKGGKGGRR